jgi:hypothetical protein
VRKARLCDLSLLKLLGVPGSICEAYKTFRVVVTSGGVTNAGGGVVMSFACRVLIVENNFAMSLFVDWVASTCSHRLVSMFWSHLASIAIE